MIPRTITSPTAGLVPRQHEKAICQVSECKAKSYPYDRWIVFLVVFRLLDFIYLFLSIPLRIGFFFDPFVAHAFACGTWRTSTTVFTVLDVVAEGIAFSHIAGLRKRQRRAIASLADAAACPNVQKRKARPIPMRDPSSREDTYDSKTSNTTQTVEALSLWYLMSMLPLEWIAAFTGVNTLHVLRLHRMLRLQGVSAWWTTVNETFPSLRFLKQMHFGEKLLYQTILIGCVSCHIAACGYMLIAHFECGMEMEYCPLTTAASAHRRLDTIATRTCWAVEDRLTHASTFRKYSRAVYWASRTLITLGYYDVAPRTNLETIFSMGIQLLGAVFSTCIIATLLFIFRYRNLRRAEFNKHVDNAKHLMKLYKLPKKIQKRVFAYYDHVWNVYSGLPGEQCVLERLPEHLQTQIRYQVRIKRLYSVSFLGKEPLEFVNLLAVKLSHRVYAPRDWIIRRVPTSMYFVSIGEVILHNQSAWKDKTRLIGVGDHFASNALLHAEWNVDIVARAHTFCELHQLPHHAFHDTLHAFFGDQAGVQLERMRVQLSRKDQQQQKTEKMLGKRVTQRFTVLSIGDTLHEENMDTPIGVYRLMYWIQSIRPRNWFREWTLPESPFRYYWEHFRCICLTFIAFEVPFYLAFDGGWPFFKDDSNEIDRMWAIVVEVFFGLDFMFQCRYFAVLDPVLQTLVHDPAYLMEHYKLNGLTLDAVALLPVPLLLEILSFRSSTSRWMYLFRLLRLCRLSKFHFHLSEIVRLRNLSSRVERALRLFMYATWTMHVTGCLWFEMARLSMPPVFPMRGNVTRSSCLEDANVHQNCSWLVFDCYGQMATRLPMENKDSSYTKSFAYIRSFYWAVVALTTIGYGDVVAFSTAESLFAALWVFIGGIINYVVVAAMSNIISSSLVSKRDALEKINHTNILLTHFGVAEPIATRIRKYYQQRASMGQKLETETLVLQYIPDHLGTKISRMLHADAIKSISLFQGRGRLLVGLMGLFRRRMFYYGDLLSPVNAQVCDEMMVIVSGRVDGYSVHHPHKVPLHGLSDGHHFGVAEMLLRQPLALKLVARSAIVEASMLTYAAFETMERQFAVQVQELKKNAMQQLGDDRKKLEAIESNLMHATTLLKYSQSCTTLFADDSVPIGSSESSKEALRLVWEPLMILLYSFNAYSIMFRIAFLSDLRPSRRVLMLLSDIVQDFVLWIDLYLCLYYLECKLATVENLWTRNIRDQRVSFSSWNFRLRIMSLMPLYYLSTSKECARGILWMTVLRVPRLWGLAQIGHRTNAFIMQLQQRFPTASGHQVTTISSLIKLLSVLLFVAHVGACVFYTISAANTHALENPNSWISHDHVVVQQLGHRVQSQCASLRVSGVLYIRALYWALTTLTLVGSKEVTPLDRTSTVWAVLACLCCTFVVGHIVGELSELMLEDDKGKKELHERIHDLEQYAKENSLPSSLRARSLHYLKYHFAHTKGMELAVQDAFRDLSQPLKAQLMESYHRRTLEAIPIARFLNKVQLHTLAMRLRPQLYIPGDIVVRQGDPGYDLFIIRHGISMVVWENTGSIVATLSSGAMFGEVAFFLSQARRTATVQTMTCSEIYAVDRETWQRVLPSFFHDIEPGQDPNGLHSNIRPLRQPRRIGSTEVAICTWVQHCLEAYGRVAMEIIKETRPEKGQVAAPGGGIHRPAHPHRLEKRASSYQSPARRTNGRERRNLTEGDRHESSERRRPTVIVDKAESGREAETLKSTQMHSLSQWSEFSSSHKVDVDVQDRVMLMSFLVRIAREESLKAQRHGTVLEDTLKVGRFGKAISRLTRILRLHRTNERVMPRKMLTVLASHAPLSNFQHSVVQLNPITPSIRGLLCPSQVQNLVEECWRRYRETVLLIDVVTKCCALRSSVNDSKSDIDAPDKIWSHSPLLERAVAEMRKNQIDEPLDAPMVSDLVIPFEASVARVERISSQGPPPMQAVYAYDDTQLVLNAGSRIRTIDQCNTRRKRSQSMTLPNEGMELDSNISKEPNGLWMYNYEMLRQSKTPSSTILFRLYMRFRQSKPSSTPHSAVVTLTMVIFENFASLLRKWSRRWLRPWRKMKRKVHAALIGMPSYDDSDNVQMHPDGPMYASGGAVGHVSSLSRLLRHSTSIHPKSPVPNWSSQQLFPKPQKLDLSKQLHVDKKTLTTDFWHFLIRLYRLWEMLMLGSGLWYATAVPLILAFFSDMETLTLSSNAMFWQWYAVSLVLELVVILNVILRWTAFSSVVQLELNNDEELANTLDMSSALLARKKSRVNASCSLLYKKWSWIGGIFPLPMSLCLLLLLGAGHKDVECNKWRYLGLLQLNKLLGVYPLLKECSENIVGFVLYDLKWPLDDGWVHFLRSVGAYILAGHWIACVWYRTGLYSLSMYHLSWISMNGMLSLHTFTSLDGISYLRRYVRSMHFAIGSITTVFYGDIVSVNLLETLVEIAIILTSIFILGILVGAHSERLEARYKQRMLLEQGFIQVQAFATRNKLPETLQDRIKQHFNHTWIRSHGQDSSLQLHGLSNLLLQDIVQYRLHQLSKHVKIFKSCDTSFLRSLLTHLKFVVCSNDDVVAQKGEIERSMYFIVKGSILVSGKGFALVKNQGDYFGELSLLYGIPRSATCSSIGMSLLYVLEWEQYERLLKKYPHYLEYNRREWVVLSTQTHTSQDQFRAIMDIIARTKDMRWQLVHKVLTRVKQS
ncbi:unnamed protein product [Albugo candida]|uniref:Cyclic nucleotide-binding domain-containing protein n=1 Tax=Albugo candida TaxID=65357 RepID=A0A024FTD8_9STRA|nr:unnamed protein product [Albugo candida]|eukprot:CCI10172.1 unnamed protein product [Albugo candida]